MEMNLIGTISICKTMGYKPNYSELSTQSATKVARKVIKGIKMNKKHIYPSFLFRFMDILNRIFPFIFRIYCNSNDKKFKKWLEENNNG